MELEQLQRHWEAFGKTDPLWAILTKLDLQEGRWDLREFMETGDEDVREVMGFLDARGIAVARDDALDFGCGVGRLTQALCRHFDRAQGVDIAPSMIEQARRINAYGERCRYHVNERSDLAIFPDSSFDFVLSLIVLQHMEPRYSTGYIREFMRVLRPGGVAVFQIPFAFEPPTSQELHPDAWRASVTVDEVPDCWPPATPQTLHVRVRNDSPLSWPAEAGLRVGNHWLSGAGRVVINDDGRALLPATVEPGGEVAIALHVRTPPSPGRYLVELDLVQEAVSWFAARGSSTLRFPVRIAEPGGLKRVLGRLTGDGREKLVPVMEGYWVPREEVVATVEGAGGHVVDSIEKDVCGGGFQSYHYIALRR